MVDRSKITDAALALFVSLAGRKSAELLQRRESLCKELLGDRDITIVPLPPLETLPGIIGFRRTSDGRGARSGQLHVAWCDLNVVDHNASARGPQVVRLRPPQLNDERGNAPFNNDAVHPDVDEERTEWQPTVHEATLAGMQPPLDNSTATTLNARVIGWVARVFRQVAIRQIVDLNTAESIEYASICPPTCGNILAPPIPEGRPDLETELDDCDLIGFCVPYPEISTRAFARGADGYLKSHVIPPADALLWQVGVALADLIGVLDDFRIDRRYGRGMSPHDEESFVVSRMMRIGLKRLCGSVDLGRPLPAEPGSVLPSMVERLLKRMEAFAEQDTASRLAFVYATLADRRAWGCLIDGTPNMARPGAAASVLSDLAREMLSEELAFGKYLPVAESSFTTVSDIRRPAAAWLSFASRVRRLNRSHLPSDVSAELNAVVAGARIQAFASTLRAAALEQCSALSASERDQLVKTSRITLDELMLEGPPLLLSDGVVDETCEGAVTRLLTMVCAALAPANTHPIAAEGDQRESSWPYGLSLGDLGDVTPLGWAVLLGAASGLWRGVGIRTSWTTRELNGEINSLDECREKFLSWVRHLAMRADGTDTGEPPFGRLSRIIGRWSSGEGVQDDLMEAMRALDKGLGITVLLRADRGLRIRRGKSGVVHVELSGGEVRVFEPWQIQCLARNREPRSPGKEIESLIANEERTLVWSEVRYEKGEYKAAREVSEQHRALLLSISVVSAAVAETCFGSEHASMPMAPVGPRDLQARTRVEESAPSAFPRRDQSRDVVDDDRGVTSHGAEAVSCIRNSPSSDHALARFSQRQLREWTSRSESACVTRAARIALLQWDVDESYRHPLYDACVFDDTAPHDLRERDSRPDKWQHNRALVSCAEHRRRRLLESALVACKAFNVDVLLMPEYSVRPDTIQFLCERLHSMSPNTSVWAGTYRVPPQYEGSFGFELPPNPWEAQLAIVLPQKVREFDDRQVLVRSKRYPAVGANELFAPANMLEPLKPLFYPQPPLFDPRSFIAELICSEAFLVTSPVNLVPIAQATAWMARLVGSGTHSLKDTMERALGDLREFGRHVHGASSEYGDERAILFRRSILLVPAMSSRERDYQLLGNGSFLAVNMVTVFCNAVLNKFGNGGSCFIGHEGSVDGYGMPTYDPYHGVAPGIFNAKDKLRGALGRSEQAMVIADIDLECPAMTQPRKQTHMPPLRLVAHLPIVFHAREESVEEKAQPLCSCKSKRVLSTQRMQNVAADLLAMIEKGDAAGYRSTIDDPTPEATTAILRTLADMVEARDERVSGSGWLHRRARAFRRFHLSNPRSWPPPVAIDWLAVDLDVGAMPTVEVPAFAKACADDSWSSET